MQDLPNGFTGFSNRKPGFESAGEAMRKSRAAAEREAADPAKQQRISHTSWSVGEDTNSSTVTVGGAGNVGHLESNLWAGRTRADNPSDMKRFLRVPNVAMGEEAPVYDKEALSDIPEEDRRWSWVEIDLGAIRHNLLEARRAVGQNVMIMAVVKADGYGHGAVECARTALNTGADYLGVATVDEGIELRDAGIGAPILILGEPPVDAIPLLLAYQLMPSAYTAQFLIRYGEAADTIGLRAPYHLAVNTGMNRIGVRWTNIEEFMHQVQFHRALELVGTFTHFATADAHDTMDFDFQLSNFYQALETLHQIGIDPGIVHAANSAAIFRYPETHFHMVRMGISMYGYYPSPEIFGLAELIPSMSVHARITDVRTVPLGEGVSYGLRFRSRGYTKVCTIPVGYADGYSRGLSDNTSIIVRGRMYPQVGAICMDQSMFAVEQRSRGTIAHLDPQIGDEVMVVGIDGDSFVTIDEIADKLGTIPYEVCINFGCSRMPRIYRSRRL